MGRGNGEGTTASTMTSRHTNSTDTNHRTAFSVHHTLEVPAFFWYPGFFFFFPGYGQNDGKIFYLKPLRVGRVNDELERQREEPQLSSAEHVGRMGCGGVWANTKQPLPGIKSQSPGA